MRCSELFDQLNELDEHPRIEAKTAREVSASLMETICAYANEPGLSGGFLLLGIHECEEPRDRKYCVVGIGNPDKIQRDIAEQCASRFNRVVRPECFVETVEGKAVVGIFVPEAQAGDKPIFFKKVGLPKGAFRRIGSTNQQCTDDDLQVLYQERRVHPYDETIVADATLDDLDGDAIAEYRRVRTGVDPDAEELRWSDAELLESLHCVKMRENTLRPTVAGLILFGSKKALRKFFPMMRLDYLRVPGRNWVEDPDHPFEAIEMREPLFHLLSRGLAAIMDDIPRAFTFTSDGLMRQEEPRIPPRVIREALVNALMHRSYLIHSPVQVIRYANRLEIRNPGHSLKPVESLGEPGSKPRNPTIAGVLHETKFAESKGSGIRVMRQLMKSARLSPPTFESEREQDLFTATFLMHHFLDQQDLQWLEHFKDANLSADEARILIHAREIGSVNNAICRDYTGLDTLAASGTLRRLRDLGLLVQHSHASATYYTPTRRLLHPGEEEKKTVEGGGAIGGGHPVPEGLPTMPEGLPAMPEGLPAMPEGLPAMPEGLPAYLPTKLAEAIRNLGQRSPPGQVQQVITELCSIRAYTADELAVLLRRNKKWVFRSYLSPLLRAGILEYTIPENPRHPMQAYRTKT